MLQLKKELLEKKLLQLKAEKERHHLKKLVEKKLVEKKLLQLKAAAERKSCQHLA